MLIGLTEYRGDFFLVNTDDIITVRRRDGFTQIRLRGEQQPLEVKEQPSTILNLSQTNISLNHKL